ncbi:MAG: hypothetical protein ACYC9S_05720 [Leptospirales bacterium]
MTVAHLHPILVHFALGWGLFWVVRDLWMSSKDCPGPAPLFLQEGALIGGILGIASGWLALAWDQTKEFRGIFFWPGAIHEGLAILAVGLIGTRILGDRWFSIPQTRPFRLGMGGTLLLFFFLTGITGEWLVFGWGATGTSTLPH